MYNLHSWAVVLGWGALINQPLALTFGKRGIYLFSLLGNMVGIYLSLLRVEG